MECCDKGNKRNTTIWKSNKCSNAGLEVNSFVSVWKGKKKSIELQYTKHISVRYCAVKTVYGGIILNLPLQKRLKGNWHSHHCIFLIFESMKTYKWFRLMESIDILTWTRKRSQKKTNVREKSNRREWLTLSKIKFWFLFTNQRYIPTRCAFSLNY